MGLIFNRNYEEPEKLVKVIIPELMEIFLKFLKKIHHAIIPPELSVFFYLAKIYYEGEAVKKNNSEEINKCLHISSKLM